MAWARNKRALTPANVGEFLGVDLRTVIRWIQKGELNAYQLPGSNHNRVRLADFIKFLEDNHMPIPAELNTSNRVLIVEDDKTAAEALENPLRELFEPVVARTAFEAGQLVTALTPAVVIIDPARKDLGGFDLIRTLSNAPDLFAGKVLVVSALPVEQLEAAMEAGAWAMMSKPFTSVALNAAVVQLCQQTQDPPVCWKPGG